MQYTWIIKLEEDNNTKLCKKDKYVYDSNSNNVNFYNFIENVWILNLMKYKISLLLFTKKNIKNILFFEVTAICMYHY